MKHVTILLVLTLLISLSTSQILTDFIQQRYPAAFLTASPTHPILDQDAIKETQDVLKSSATHRDIDKIADIIDFFISFYSSRFGSYSVAVVRNGSVVYTQGFGSQSADTIYCAASVSKSFTAAAIMQLAQQGKLDLHADIKTYVPEFEFYGPYKDVVTVGDLLTHTAGFEERQPYTIVRELDQLDSLETFVKSRMPPKSWKTNTLASYSNHAYVLAGYIIEKVSGIPYNTYMKEHILDPLNMTSSTFDSTQVDKERLAPEYLLPGVPLPITYEINIGPAGGLFTTVGDLSNFVIAKLNNGTFGMNEILSPEYNKIQYSEIYKNGLNIPGIGYGFYFYDINGKRIVNHDGDMPGYTASLWFVPEEDFGVVVLQNSKASIRTAIQKEFMDSFFPGTNPHVDGVSKEISKGAGGFSDTRTDRNSYCSLMNTFLSATIPISYASDSLNFNGIPTKDMGNMSFFLSSFQSVTPVPVMSYKDDTYNYIALLSPVTTFQRTDTVMLIIFYIAEILLIVTSCAHCCCRCRRSVSYVELQNQGGETVQKKNPFSAYALAVVIGLVLLSLISTLGLIFAILSSGPLFNPHFSVSILLVFPYIFGVMTVLGLGTFAYSILRPDTLSQPERITLLICSICSGVIVGFLALNNVYFAF